MTDPTFADYDGMEIALGGNWTEEDSLAREPYDPSQSRVRYATMTHEKISSELYYEYLENEYAAPAFRFLTNLLFGGWTVEGPGADAINNYFDKVDLTGRKELWEAGLWSLIDGNGYLYKIVKDGKLRQLKNVSPYSFSLTWDSRKKDYGTNEETLYGDPTATNGENRYIKAVYGANAKEGADTIAKDEKEYYFRQYPRLKPEDWRNDNLVLMQLEPELDGTPNGMSIIRACLHALKGLKMTNRNVLAAIDRLLASILVILYDTSSLKDDQKATKLQALSKKLKQLNAATSGGMAIDKAHQIGYVGSLPGSTPMSDEKIIKVMEHIEPVMSAVLLNFLIPIGIIEQTGANKSLIATQAAFMITQVNLYRDTVKTILKTQVFPHITDQEVDIKFAPHIEVETLTAMFQIGAISREYLQRILGIEDDGEEFAPNEQLKLQAALKPPTGQGNQDGSTKREPQKKYS